MEGLKLVVRQRLDHDQRRVRVSLTPKSRRLVARMAPRIDETYQQIEEQLGAAFVEHFYGTLDEVIARLATAKTGERDD